MNLEKIKESLIGIRSQVNDMIKKEEETIKNFESAVIAHYSNEITEEEILKFEEEQRLKAEQDNKEIDKIFNDLKDKLKALGLTDEQIEKQFGK